MNISSYRFSLILMLSIVLGGVVGIVWGSHAVILKPLGTVFLNLLYTVIVPLIFFSVSSAIVNIKELKRLRKILFVMISIFIVIGAIAAFFMIIGVILFPPAQGVSIHLSQSMQLHPLNIGKQVANILTVPNITQLFLPSNMLSLIFFAILIGLATAMSGEKGKPFARFLQSGADVFMTLISFVMYYAPIGFFAFFALLVAKLGPSLFHAYFRATLLYYISALIYFFLMFSLLAYFSNKKQGLKKFWKNIIPPSMTALATCSSAASIPPNLQAARNMQLPRDLYETVIPLGTMINKQGSVLGGVIKIAFLFGIFHMHFLTPFALGSTVIVAILVGTVMGAIPSGGMLGEMLILSIYGFPPEALFIIATISIIIDPLATLLNVTGNTISVVVLERLLRVKNKLHDVICSDQST